MLSTAGVDCWGRTVWASWATGPFGGPDGVGDGNDGYDSPQAVTDVTDAVSVTNDGNGGGSCALLTTGGVECWGDDSDGQLGSGTTGGSYDTPQAVSGIADAVSVTGDGGGRGYCAVLSSGEMDCWGYNAFGELGNGRINGIGGNFGYDTPQGVTGITNALSVANDGFGRGYCAVLSTGGVDCWGYNEEDELGNGTIFGPDGAAGYDKPQAVSSQ